MRKGWHSRGYLPHCDEEHLVQHVVFRLKDSLPEPVVQAMKLLGKTQRLHRTDAALDVGHGSKLLADERAASLVVDALQHFDGERYMLLAWCVMPNHVHVLMEPLGEHELGGIVKSWKTFSATQINRALSRTGPVWAADYFDRFMRDGDQLSMTVAYIEDNPVRAGLADHASKWLHSSAALRVASTEVRA
jgi:REP element-mobilizing transposase RayT